MPPTASTKPHSDIDSGSNPEANANNLFWAMPNGEHTGSSNSIKFGLCLSKPKNLYKRCSTGPPATMVMAS